MNIQIRDVSKMKLKRDILQKDFVILLKCVKDINFPEAKVKIMSENIYIPEIGIYVVVVWDFITESPKLLALNHTIFQSLKRWRSDSGQDAIGKTFSILSKENHGIIYHDLICKSLLPFLSVDVVEKINEYIDNLFEEDNVD